VAGDGIPDGTVAACRASCGVALAVGLGVAVSAGIDVFGPTFVAGSVWAEPAPMEETHEYAGTTPGRRRRSMNTTRPATRSAASTTHIHSEKDDEVPGAAGPATATPWLLAFAAGAVVPVVG
jgi:hypothetical protein